MRAIKDAAYGLAFVLPHLSGLCLFSVLPFGQVILRSLRSAAGTSWVGTANYKEVLKNAAFLLAAKNTLRFTAVCIPLLLALSLLLAFLVFRQKAVGALLKSAFLLPMAVPAASVVLIWRVLFHQNGLLNALLVRLGAASVAWMTSDASFCVLVLAYLWKNTGYDMVLWLAGLSAISPDIYEAARVDGAGSLACFWHITLPNLRTSLYTITVLSLLNSFKVFREAWLVAGDYPQQSMYLLQHLYNNWFRELSFEKIAAAAVISALPVLGLIAMLQLLTKERG